LVPLLAALVACGAAEPRETPYEFVVRAESDPGEPLAGAVLTHAGQVLGKSNAQGALTLSAQGVEGESLSLDVRCPENFRSPNKPLVVALRKLSEPKKRPEYRVSCPPLTRTLLVAVRADNGPNLPVRRLGRELARTDGSGAALVALDVAPEEAVDLTLDTSESPWLKPKDPSQHFRISARDELFTFNQSFEGKATPRVRPRSHSGPIRIDVR
jgi:hypothetical protein